MRPLGRNAIALALGTVLLAGCAQARDAAKTADPQQAIAEAPPDGLLRMQLRGLSSISADVATRQPAARRWVAEPAAAPMAPAARPNNAAEPPGSARERLIQVLSGKAAPVPQEEPRSAERQEPQPQNRPAQAIRATEPSATAGEPKATAEPAPRAPRPKPAYPLNDLF